MKNLAFGDSLAAAWELMFDWKLPGFLAARRQGAGGDWTMLLAVLLGTAAGLLLFAVGLVARMIFAPLGAALIFALIALFFLEAKDSGRGSGMLLQLVPLALKRQPVLAALPYLEPLSLAALREGAGRLEALLLLGFKFVALVYLGYKGAWMWMVAVCSLAFAVQIYLATLPELHSGRPLVHPSFPPEAVWIVGIFPVLFVAIRYPSAALLGIAAAGVLAVLARRAYVEVCGGVTGEMVSLAGSLAEVLLLLAGILMIG